MMVKAGKGKFLFIVLFAAFSLFVPIAAAADDPEIVVREIPGGWAGSALVPVQVDIRSARGARVEISVHSDGRNEFTAHRSVTVPSGAVTTVEMPVWVDRGYSLTVQCRSGEVAVEKTLYQSYQGSSASVGGYPVPVICLNGYMLREIELFAKPPEKESLNSFSVPVDSLPRRWQSYASLDGMLVVDTREAGKIHPEQREALAMWVKWLGGSVWLAGPGGEETAVALGLERKAGSAGNGPVERYPLLTGEVFLQEKPDVDDIVAMSPVRASDPDDRRGWNFTNNLVDTGYRDTENILVRDLDGISNYAIILCLAILGLVMGPLNFWYIRKRKRPLLFFITTPIIAFAGTVAIVVASMLAEGVGGRYREFAVFLRDGNGAEGMLVHARGVRPGFFTPNVSFPVSALVAPVTRRWRNDNYVVALDSDAIRLASGWFRPRFPTAVTVAIPLVGRMNIDIVEDRGNFYAVNNLGYRVDTLAARLPGGGFGQAEKIAPGERALLKTGRGDSALKGLLGQAGAFLSRPVEPGKASLVARCDGLPQAESRGVGGSRVSGEYYYCVLDAGEGAP